jgi:hypothetical protein
LRRLTYTKAAGKNLDDILEFVALRSGNAEIARSFVDNLHGNVRSSHLYPAFSDGLDLSFAKTCAVSHLPVMSFSSVTSMIGWKS